MSNWRLMPLAGFGTSSPLITVSKTLFNFESPAAFFFDYGDARPIEVFGVLVLLSRGSI